MKSKGLQTTIFSMAGVAAMFAILLAVNWIAARAKQRIDLTAERAYTLSEGTRNILKKLDTPVLIRFYATRGENRMPVMLKNHAQNVEDLLDEYRQGSKGKIEIQKLDPEPDSDAEDSAKLDGIEGHMVTMGGEPFYLGLSVTMLDQKETMSFLDPQAGRLLEYELSRAISRVATPDKPVIGIISSLPIAGQPMNPMMMRSRQPPQPWHIYEELTKTYNVKQLDLTVDRIPDDVKALVLIHPKGLGDATQYAIDQFVLRGGKMIAFLDPLAVLDQQSQGQFGASSSSNLEKLLKAWGLTFDSTKVVADVTYIANLQQGRTPAVLDLNETALHQSDVLTAGNDKLLLGFAGAFSGTPAEGLKQTVLIHSSKDSQLVDPMMAQMGGEQIVKDFKASGTEHTLALRLTGRFKSAFPEGKPKAEEPKPEDGKPPEKKPDAPAEQGLKESSADGAVILVGDSDFIQDPLSVQTGMNPFGGGKRMVIPLNSNIAFAQGAVEQLAGDSNLIAVRSRASRERPFTVVKKMQADAEARHQNRIKELEAKTTDINRKITELLRSKVAEGARSVVLPAEQQQEIANFRKDEAEAKKELKQVRKKLRADIDSLENRVKWFNIAGMPLLVVALGVVLAVKRRSRQAAT
jgi:ABC-type uncharacterized transport system involved in gliding motility auxiliary subunit